MREKRLVDVFRRHKYQKEDIFEERPFLVHAVLFKSIFCWAHHDLAEIAAVLEEDTAEIEEWVGQTSKAISEDLWCERCSKFQSFDLGVRTHIHTATAPSFMPLFAVAASRDQAELLNWYRKNFGGSKEIFHFLLKHLHEDERSRFLTEHMQRVKVEYLFYDWNLNH